MSASHPTFNSGHCFMTETLNKQEVEYVGAMLHMHLIVWRTLVPTQIEPSEYLAEVKRVNTILKKMDHPLFEEGAAQ
ncbi:hypothetical protein [Brucella anthropi]|uniref:hypothetical protein n=1 Tax=Brucella anthropi TaxID=529 RepID=UPI000F67D210|nr:hypothetical protein [Brucella anthropi]RRY03801.1 hypothetical protein EGJ58_22115 [Brucella anthropi]